MGFWESDVGELRVGQRWNFGDKVVSAVAHVAGNEN